MVQVRATRCKTCIYHSNSNLKAQLPKLEEDCKDEHGFFVSYRVCHKHQDENHVCCRGFYDTHGVDCTPLQISDRLGFTEFSNEGEERNA